jgi:Zinc finger, C3HC4 type (RING finger)
MASLPPPVLASGSASNNGVIYALTCTLCHELSMDPWMTPCDHIFCRACIVEALSHKSECPNDRQHLGVQQLQPISGVLRRIWDQIPVKCPIGNCAWNGTVGSYAGHAVSCSQQQHSSQETLEEIAELQEELQAKSEEILQLKSEVFHKTSEIENLRCALNRASALSFDTNYKYDRSRVVELTQLICKYLENKPEAIDRNRIYNCVKCCYDDLKAGYNDNPDHYYIDVRTLLNVCLGSTWFSSNQRQNVESWSREQGWY